MDQQKIKELFILEQRNADLETLIVDQSAKIIRYHAEYVTNKEKIAKLRKEVKRK